MIFTIFFNPVSAKERLDVVFLTDNKYTIYTLLTINSIFINNESNSDYNIYIIENNLNNKNKKILKNFIEKNNAKVKFIKWDINKLKEAKEVKTRMGRWSDIILAKLFIPGLLPDDCNKIIYLDSDMLITQDLIKLYNFDMGDYLVSMLNEKHNDATEYIKGHYNAGTIVYNTKKMERRKNRRYSIKISN